MFNLGKITQATYEYLSKDLNGAITELKARQKCLTEEMTPKTKDPEKQLNAPPPPPPAVVKAAHAEKLTKILAKEIVAIPEIVVSAPAKKGRKRVRKTKKRRKKASVRKLAPKKVRPKATSRGHCRNPWNGKCRNTNTEVLIYYNNKRLPICRDCWHEIVDKNIMW